MEQKEISVNKVGTDDYIADHSTNPLPQAEHDGHVALIGLKRIPVLL